MSIPVALSNTAIACSRDIEGNHPEIHLAGHSPPNGPTKCELERKFRKNTGVPPKIFESRLIIYSTIFFLSDYFRYFDEFGCWWARTQRIRTLAELPFKVEIVDFEIHSVFNMTTKFCNSKSSV